MAVLECHELTRRFGALVAVDQVNMVVEKGEVCAIIGPNGAGKSTLFNLITGTIPTSEGEVRLDGQAITGRRSHDVCQLGISRTFQITHIFPEMTALENVRLAAQGRLPGRWRPLGGAAIFEEADKHAISALDRIGIAHLADVQASYLAHGDQRLLEIAMALAQNPRVLLLDEPTQGLSVEETQSAVGTLRDLLKDRELTVLLVEHDMEVVFDLAERITVLHRGRVIADGMPDEVKASADVQEAYLGGLE